MKLQVRVLGGARAGTTAVFSQAEITVGRHPSCDLQFHPERDLDVSARHLLLARRADRWMVRDLGSRNGTLLNGHPIRGDTALDDTDQVRLGPEGPALEIRLVADSVPDRRPTAPSATRADGTPMRPTSGTPGGGSATQQIRMEVDRQTRRHRVVIGVLVGLLIVAATYFVVDRRQQAVERSRERAAFQARIDSILRTSADALAQLQGQVAGLGEALQRSQGEIQRMQAELGRAEAAGQRDEVTRLRTELAAAAQALRTQQVAALVDYRAIHEANNAAVAMIWVEYAPGDVASGTAFAVRPDGTLVTSRHLIVGEDGTRRPRRLAVQFTNSAQVWRARVLGTSGDADLAAVRVQGIAGTVPVIPLPATIPSLKPGDPVVTIGFPFGNDLPMRSAGEQDLVRTTLMAGTVSKVLPDVLQIDGYGAQGASGSPVFDREGTLIGVLYGGEPGATGRIVYLVPVNYVTALLRDPSVASAR
jgi:S1-C subfamily serine protease/pSer/pThr/pTyr-binding forkhead associated (FHA) protein